MENSITFLGTGTSQGQPMIGCDCARCTSSDPRDKRLRASAFIRYGGLSILVDAGPDFRYQMLRAGIRHIDAILLTHNHKDHTGGLDDVRAFNLVDHHPVSIFCEKYVEETLRGEYPYAFSEVKYQGSPEFDLHIIDGGHPFTVHSNSITDWLEWKRGYGYVHLPPKNPVDNSVSIIPIQGWHLRERALSVLGYRFGKIAYLTDISVIDDDQFEKLRDLDVITLGCVKMGPHHSHPSLLKCLEFFERVGAKESYITHISHLLPCHEEFDRILPANVHPAYDGLTLKCG